MRIRLTIMLSVLAVWLQAAPQYRTKRLQQIVNKSGIRIPETIPSGVRDDSIGVFRGHNICLRTDGFGDIAHIGYSLFNQQTFDVFNNTKLLEFIERYLLELDLGISELGLQKRMDVDRVVMVEGNWNMVRQLTPATDVSLSYEEIARHVTRLTIMVGGQRAVITIPSDCQLLLGANAIELEKMACNDLRRIVPSMTDDKLLSNRWMKMQRIRADQVEIVDGGYYISQQIRGDIYLSRKKGKLLPVCSPSSPLRSVSNMMLTGYANRELPMRLEINQYGFKSDTIDIALQQLTKFCENEGCRLYFGFKTHSDEFVTGTLFACNQQLAYTHLISVEFPLSILYGREDVIKAKAYFYIPIQNIPDKFFTQDFKPLKE